MQYCDMKLVFLKAILRGIRRCVTRWTALAYAKRCSVKTCSVLVIAPHPDDEVFGTGGMIALKRAAGVQVNVLYLTQGESSHRDCCNISQADIARSRRRLASEAARLLSLDPNHLHWLDLPDGNIPGKAQDGFDEATSRVLELVEKISPNEVYCPHPFDCWQDHVAASEIVREALYRYNHQCELIYYLVWAWHSQSLRRLMKLGWSNSWCLDIGQVFEKKQAAMKRYLSERVPSCGKPYIGTLPLGFLVPFHKPYEVFFEYHAKKCC